MKGQTTTATMTRRRALMGSAASIATLGLTSIDSGATAGSASTDMAALGAELDRLRRRCNRLYREVRRLSELADSNCEERGIAAWLPDHRRNIAFDAVRREFGYDRSWKRWSATVSASLDLVQTIRRLPASDVAGVSVKYSALLWELFHHEMALAIDADHLRLLTTFGRELQKLGH